MFSPFVPRESTQSESYGQLDTASFSADTETGGQLPYSPSSSFLHHDSNLEKDRSCRPLAGREQQQSILHWVGPSFASDLSECLPSSPAENMQTASGCRSTRETGSCQQDTYHLPYEKEQADQRHYPSTLLSNEFFYSVQQQRLSQVVGQLEQLEYQQRLHAKWHLRAISDSKYNGVSTMR